MSRIGRLEFELLKSRVTALETGFTSLEDRVDDLEGEPDDPPPPPPFTVKRVLSQQDFTYLGHWRVAPGLGAGELHWGQGFTHRYVDGKLRFLTLAYRNGQRPDSALNEFAPPDAFGGTTTERTGVWPDIKFPEGFNAPGAGAFNGLWWDAERNRLWSTSGIRYPGTVEAAWTRSIMIRSLNADGTVGDVHGWFGVQGVNNRRVYGGVCRIPNWFADRYCGGRQYGVGFGGVASIASAGVSCGPTLYAVNPAGSPNNADLEKTTLLDHSAATGYPDWYGLGIRTPSTPDRGIRNADVINEMDAGNWKSPAPDGLGRWTLQDGAWNTGCWIEGPNQHGFLIIGSFVNGRLSYGVSEPVAERRSWEFQVYDPAQLGEVAEGRRKPWDCKPVRWELKPPGLGPVGWMGPGLPHQNVSGASWDDKAKRLYLYCPWADDGYPRIWVYSASWVGLQEGR